MNPPKTAAYTYTPLSGSFQRCLEQAINQISQAISLLLKTIQQIYQNLSIGFFLQTEYVHKIFMSMICPVQLRVQYNLDKTCYFTRTSSANIGQNKIKQTNRQNDNTIYEKIENNSQQLLNKNIIKRQFRQDIQKLEKNKNQVKQRLKQKLQEKLQILKQPQKIQYQEPQMIEEVRPLVPLKTYVPQPLSEIQKSQIIGDWIKQQTKEGRNIRIAKLIQKIMIVTSDYQTDSARKWFNSFLKKSPEISDLLTFSGNLHLINLKIKSDDIQHPALQMQAQQSQQVYDGGKIKYRSSDF